MKSWPASTSTLTPQKSVILHPKTLRKLGKADIKQVQKLVDPKVTEELFGCYDVGKLMSLSYLTVGLEDESGRIAAAMVLHTNPGVPALPPWEWDHWLYRYYDICDAYSYNTLWVQFVVWDKRFETFFMKIIVSSIFKQYPAMRYLLWLVPPYCNVMTSEFMHDLASKHLPKGCFNSYSSQILHCFKKESFHVQYKIRRAVEEDNDDLVPLIHQHSKRLEELYGKYYIAEILTSHKDTGRHIIVAEFEGNAVAVVILNPTVNYKVLNEEFELATFNGLRKNHESDEVQVCKRSHSIAENILSQVELNVIASIHQLEANISNKESTSSRCSDELLISVSDSEGDYSIVLTTSSFFLYQDEDDEEPPAPSISTSSGSVKENSFYEVIKEMGQFRPETDPRITFVDMMENLDLSRDSTTSKSQKLPTFYGEDNAFCLEVAAADPDHEYCLSLILEYIFECFPDRDYCILHLPSNTPLEDWISPFVRVISRSTGTFPNELYALHKNAFLGRLDVEVITRDHMPDIKDLIATIPMNSIIITQCEIFLDIEKSPYTAFVLLCENKVVGVAVLSEEFNIDHLDTHYETDPWINPYYHKSGNYGLIESILVSPIFQNHAQYFMSEIHRLGDFTAVFYKYNPEKTGKERPVVNLLHWFLPVMPRQQPELNNDILIEEGYPLPSVVLRKENFVLYLSSVSLCAISRYSLNTRIVVVGCSSTALAFLISLACTQYNPNYLVTFNNITLVCQYGIQPRLPKKIIDLFLADKNFFGGKYMDMLSLKTHVNVVQGTMTKIDRKDKYIVINEHYILNYDILFLMSGEKFQKPLKNNKMPFAENPENMFLIQCGTDAHNACNKLKQMESIRPMTTEHIVVYGHYLQAYTCLAALLSFGIAGTNIILVEPFPYVMNIDRKQRQNISIFNDPEIYHSVKDQIIQQGITVYSSYYFIDWNYDKETNLIRSAKFESKHKMIDLECWAIFFYYDKNVSPRMYQVINNAGLVFDGRLVIDNTCRTNDPYIYGAGTLTKYSRKYYASHMIHKYFNRVEIGHKLGQQIRSLLIPFFIRKFEPKRHSWNFQLNMSDRLVPIFQQPVLRYSRLPGGMYYLCIDKPGKSMPWVTASTVENSGRILITGNCHNLASQGFFKLQIDEYGRVESITCLTKSPIDVKNLYCIWGKHESLLNNLQNRFEMLMITDFFQFFRAPWAHAIYHDRFEDLMKDLNYIITSSTGNEGDSLIQDVIQMYEERKWGKLTIEEEKEIELKFSQMLYPKILEEKLLDFIKDNINYLPMYAHPIVIRKLLEGFDKSPLFRRW